MAPSILRNVLFAFLGFGALVAGAFPFYANFFVEWKEGMLPWFVFGCFIAGLFIGVANYWVMNWVLVSKLRRISQVASAIANKDLSFTCAMQSHDTIGEIIISFNHMAATLRELIARTSELSSRVNSDSNGIQVQTGHIHESVDSLAERSQEISLAIHELDNAISSISERSANASRHATDAGAAARQGINVSRDSISGMERINSRVASATNRVEQLNQSTQEVGTIVAVIKEIADQTNLLALNAAIEAARAGEQGRGFAVVADEVRKLAEKTSDATNEISSMISAIQSETREAIIAITESMNEAKLGVEHARSSGETLERISHVVEAVVGQVQEIALEAKSQNDAVARVRDSVQAIQALNQGTLEDANRGVSMAANLSLQANKLDDAVKSFKL